MEKYYIRSNKYSTAERRLKNGKRVYDLIFRVVTIDGKTTQKMFRGFSSKTLAKEFYMDFVTKHCELIRYSRSQKLDEARQSLIVGDLVREYIATLGNQNKQSVIYDKTNVFNNYILPKYKNTPVMKLTKEELFKWQDELWAMKNERTGDYFSYKYLSKIRGFFSTFLTWCAQRYSVKNNFEFVTKPKRRAPKTEMSFWTESQFEQFIKVVDNQMYKTLFTFMFYTGRRKGELFALYKTDVRTSFIIINKSVSRRTFRNATWEITSTKADKNITIPICRHVKEAINAYTPPKEGKFYFGGENPLASTTVDRYFKKYIAQANLPPIRIHDLRHSFVSLLIHHGATFPVVAELISDTIEQVTKTYAHVYVSDVMEIINSL